jgi:uncharacterized protein (TIGR02246 family)
VTDDVAVMVAVGGTVMTGQSDIEPDRNSIHTLVAVKHGNKWRFTAFQNTRAQFIGRPAERLIKESKYIPLIILL